MANYALKLNTITYCISTCPGVSFLNGCKKKSYSFPAPHDIIFSCFFRKKVSIISVTFCFEEKEKKINVYGLTSNGYIFFFFFFFTVKGSTRSWRCLLQKFLFETNQLCVCVSLFLKKKIKDQFAPNIPIKKKKIIFSALDFRVPLLMKKKKKLTRWSCPVNDPAL